MAAAPTLSQAVVQKYQDKLRQEQVHPELVGADHTAEKQKVSTLTRVFLPNQKVQTAGNDLKNTCPNLQHLDLENNPLQGWDAVVDIATQLPDLAFLSLNKVKLGHLPTNLQDFSALGNIHTLCLSETNIEWSQLLFISKRIPMLTELHFSGNNVSSLSGSYEGVFERLQIAFLENNSISSWCEIEPLAHLPSLQVLNLSGNLLREVPSKPMGFASLRHIMLLANPIDSWASVDALDQFPALCEVRLAELPVTREFSGMVARRMIIARVGRLSVLNGSQVRHRERDDAERFYLRHVSSDCPDGALPRSGTDSPGTEHSQSTESDEWRRFEQAHPRWRLLLAKHGEQIRADVGEKSAGLLGAELLELTLRATAAEAAALPPIARKLPGGLPLKSLKAIACQLFKLEPVRQKLLYHPPGMEKEIPEPLDDDLKRLCDFGVVSGGSIVVEQEE